MTDSNKTQKAPKGHEIPVPTKAVVFKVLEKAAKPIKPSVPRRLKK